MKERRTPKEVRKKKERKEKERDGKEEWRSSEDRKQETGSKRGSKVAYITTTEIYLVYADYINRRALATDPQKRVIIQLDHIRFKSEDVAYSQSMLFWFPILIQSLPSENGLFGWKTVFSDLYTFIPLSTRAAAAVLQCQTNAQTISVNCEFLLSFFISDFHLMHKRLWAKP